MTEKTDLKPLDFEASYLIPLGFSPKTSEWLIGDDCGQLRNALNTSSKSYEITESGIECLSFNKSGNVCTCSSNGIVKAVSFPDTSDVVLDIIYRFSSQVLKIQHIEGEKEFIFMSSEDPSIIVYSIQLKEVQLTIQTNATKIKTFCVNTLGTYMVVVDYDSFVYIYSLNIEDATYNCLDTKSSLVPRNVIDDKNCLAYQPSWNPNSQNIIQVVIPSTEGILALLTKKVKTNDENEWDVTNLINLPASSLSHHNNDVNLASFSPNGKYLASADSQGVVLIWDMMTQEPIKQFLTQTGCPLVDIAWGPNIEDRYLVILSKSGATKIDDVIPSNAKGGKLTNTVLPDGVTKTSEGEVAVTTAKTMRRLQKSSNKDTNGSSVSGVIQNDGKVVDADDDMMFEESIEEIKKQTIGSLLPTTNHSTVQDDPIDMDEADADFIDDDNNNGGVGFANSSFLLQEAFQPSSTTLDDKKQRYLVWNAIGSITSREESISNRIEIKFSNTSGANKQEAFPDNYGFTLASLSYEGAFFAAPAEEPETEEQKEDTSRPGSTLYYHAFRDQTVLQGANENFTVTLNNMEAAVAVAVGRGWVAVVTSRNFLRIFSSTGLQLAVIALSGPILCLAGYETKLAIIYHTSYVAGETPDITADVIQVGGANSHQCWKDICKVRVPITTGCKLTWAGWSTDESYLLTMDSDGMLFALLQCGGWRWIPVLDSKQTRKSIDHKFWPIGVKSNKLLCVLLNGESKPTVHPQPVVCNRPFTMVIVESKEGKDRGSSFNEKCRQMMWDTLKANHLLSIMQTVAMDDNNNNDHSKLEELQRQCIEFEREADVAVIYGLVEACRLKRDALALDLARRLRSVEGCQKAIIAANKLGKPLLARALDYHMTQIKAMNESDEVIAYQPETLTACESPGNENKNDNYRGQDRNNSAGNQNQNQEQHHPKHATNLFTPTATSTHEPMSTKSLMNTRPSDSLAKQRLSLGGGTQPASQISDSMLSAAKTSMPSNPFHRSSPLSPEKKRKSSVNDSLRELGAASPSPKKTFLSRSSAMATEARANKLLRKTII